MLADVDRRCSSMAQATVLRRLVLLSANQWRIYGPPSVLQVRDYALKYKQPKEETLAYEDFRRNLRALRRKYREDYEQKQSELERLDAQASEEVRLEREAERKALEANSRNLEASARRR